MSILSAFFEALRLDPPEPLPEKAEVTIDVANLYSQRRALTVERDCYKAELRRLGWTDKNLAALVKLYDKGLKAEVLGKAS